MYETCHVLFLTAWLIKPFPPLMVSKAFLRLCDMPAVLTICTHAAGVKGDVRLNGKKAHSDDMRHVAVRLYSRVVSSTSCCDTS